MIILLSSARSLAEYLEAEELETVERPESCPRCRESDCFWRHGSYKRTVIEGCQERKISVTRLICKSCGLTVSLLQSFVVPYRQFSAAAICQAVEEYVDGTAGSYLESADDVSSKETDAQKPSCSQVFRWTDLLARRARQLLTATQKEIVLRGREEYLPERTVRSPNAGRARAELKRNRLDMLAELLRQGAVLVGDAGSLLFRLYDFFLFKAESIQAILCGRTQRLPTPHKMQCIIF